MAEAKEHELALAQLKGIVGPIKTASFLSYLKIGTAPAFFYAMFELYKAGVTTQAIAAFRDLIEIGRTHEKRLGKPHIQWAHDLSIEFAKLFANCVRMWVRDVCDLQDGDIDFDSKEPDALIMGRTWCAPLLVVMRPSKAMPYDLQRVWDRTDRETSRSWLTAFADEFSLHIEVQIKKLAGEESVKLAKQPTPTPAHDPAVKSADRPPQGAPVELPQEKLKVRREYRKLKLEERNKRMRLEFKRLEKRKPGMSMVWYSQQLSKGEISDGLDAETIRKIIRR